MAIEKASYVEWKNNVVTEEYKKVLKEGIEMVVGRLVSVQDSDHSQDQYLRGWIRGMVESLEWEPEFKEEDENA
jgi:hypothetical protein